MWIIHSVLTESRQPKINGKLYRSSKLPFNWTKSWIKSILFLCKIKEKHNKSRKNQIYQSYWCFWVPLSDTLDYVTSHKITISFIRIPKGQHSLATLASVWRDFQNNGAVKTRQLWVYIWFHISINQLYI